MTVLSRDEIATRYLEQLPYAPYPVQEEALLAWFTNDQGVLVCAPTGTGKTLIAQAVLFEALHTGQRAYYTTPLIALTDQKFHEIQDAAERWGFSRDDVGLVTGNRKVNPDAKVLIVVAEILMNRLLLAEGNVEATAVVMDEFHSFADPERGIVWELSLSMLPKTCRLMLLSATVGNAAEFLNWLDQSHGKKLELVESTERKIPLTYQFVEDQFLGEFLVDASKGTDETRKTPALVFCFNRDECWSVAELLKGMDILISENKQQLIEELNKYHWPNGVGPKLKQILRRGIGVHHAGLLPFYRRAVEDLFEKKLLSVAVCTETLAAGINLPARSVVLKSLMKGPLGKEQLIDPSSAQQIFGRAGRPQFDSQGFVFAVAHEDDVRLLRWKRQYDQIPENTKDPGLLKKKKELKRKKPDRNSLRQYWNAAHFEKLRTSPPGRLFSKGPLPWRMLAYLLGLSAEVSRIRTFIRKRMLDQPRIAAGEKVMDQMLITLHEGGYVELTPTPVKDEAGKYPADFRAEIAKPTEKMTHLEPFHGVHPLYGAFLVQLLGKASWEERVQALESVLEFPKNLLKFTRPKEVSPGPLETEVVRPILEQAGLISTKSAEQEQEPAHDEEAEERFETVERRRKQFERPPEPEYEPWFAEKLQMLYGLQQPEVSDLNVLPVWCAGELLQTYGGNFHLYVRAKDLIRQEGIVFRHLLRLILLCEEFAQVTPPESTFDEWRGFLADVAIRLTDTCRSIDPTSAEEVIQRAKAADDVAGKKLVHLLPDTLSEIPHTVKETAEIPPAPEWNMDDFAEGLFDEE